ncbi:GATA transcription factor 29 [Morus notabilis]|nr:GATA transcription factor 29 [Morus notabilis]
MKKLQYNNNYSNQAGFVDLTLRLGMPNHDYSDINNPTEICQSSLNSNYLFSLCHFNGSHMSSTTHDQPLMQYWQYGHNRMVSGDHITDNGYYNMINNTSGGVPSNYFGRIFNQTGTNLGHQIINTGPDQVFSEGPHYTYSTPNSSTFNAITSNPYTSTSISPAIMKNNIDLLCTRSRGQSSLRKNNRGKKQSEAVVVDVGEEEEEEEEEVEDDDDDDDDANKRCSNPKCLTHTTPMWRRGPLGPKSLCNACGIKYRKQEERIRAAEKIAAAKTGNTSTISNLN